MIDKPLLEFTINCADAQQKTVSIRRAVNCDAEQCVFARC